MTAPQPEYRKGGGIRRLQQKECPECHTAFRPMNFSIVCCSRSCSAKRRMRNRPRSGFYKDLTGREFGQLTVQGYSHSIPKRKSGDGFTSIWNCICACGNTKKVRQAALVNGSTISCGCKLREIQQSIKQYSPTASVTHGCARTRLGNRTQAYKVWCWMKRRCNVPKAADYKYYGALGIKVCERWNKFENFLADMGEPEPGLTIDRFPDNCGSYEPGNCRWATWEQQYANRRPRSVYIDRAGNEDILKTILILHSGDKNPREIADELNRRGIPSPRGGVWWHSTVKHVIHNHEKMWI